MKRVRHYNHDEVVAYDVAMDFVDAGDMVAVLVCDDRIRVGSFCLTPEHMEHVLHPDARYRATLIAAFMVFASRT